MKIQTKDLQGTALDWAVMTGVGVKTSKPFGYSFEWRCGGPIIEQNHIRIEPFHGSWLACIWNEDNGEYHMFYRGSKPLIAAMRCYVAFKLGDEVDVPEEVL